MNCPNLQRSIPFCEGTPVFPGVRRTLYYLNKSLILKFPKRDLDESGRVKSANLIGSFLLGADTTFKRVDVIMDKSGLTSDPQGEYPSQTQLNKLTAVHPDVGPEATAAAAYINNADNIYLVQDMKGRWRVVGCEEYPSKGTVNQDLGQGATGTASTTINVEATDFTPAPFYYGDIVTEDGIIKADGSDAEEEEGEEVTE